MIQYRLLIAALLAAFALTACGEKKEAPKADAAPAAQTAPAADQAAPAQAAPAAPAADQAAPATSTKVINFAAWLTIETGRIFPPCFILWVSSSLA